MKKTELLYLVIIIIILTGLFIYSNWRKNYINSNGVYVAAKVYKINGATNGFDYFFKYQYQGKFYTGKIGSLNIPMQDSIITLKISKRRPNLWKRIEFIILPCLLQDSSLLEKTWNELPECN